MQRLNLWLKIFVSLGDEQPEMVTGATCFHHCPLASKQQQYLVGYKFGEL